MTSEPLWHMGDGVAELRCGPLSGRLVLANPAAGWQELHWRGQPCGEFEILRASVAADSHLLDAYIRGHDFVASYSQSPTCAIAPHCYWRARHDEPLGAVGIEMILSVQTDLLDSRPGTVLRSFGRGVRVYHGSALSPGELREQDEPIEFAPEMAEPHLVVLRHEGLGLSYAQLVYPSDLDSLQLQMRHDGRSGAMAVLFQKPLLEKGVIRRARIGGWFLPAENDLAAASQLAQRFLSQPPPLTA
jgi:hypothetical protein